MAELAEELQVFLDAVSGGECSWGSVRQFLGGREPTPEEWIDLERAASGRNLEEGSLNSLLLEARHGLLSWGKADRRCPFCGLHALTFYWCDSCRERPCDACSTWVEELDNCLCPTCYGERLNLLQKHKTPPLRNSELADKLGRLALEASLSNGQEGAAELLLRRVREDPACWTPKELDRLMAAATKARNPTAPFVISVLTLFRRLSGSLTLEVQERLIIFSAEAVCALNDRVDIHSACELMVSVYCEYDPWDEEHQIEPSVLQDRLIEPILLRADTEYHWPHQEGSTISAMLRPLYGALCFLRPAHFERLRDLVRFWVANPRPGQPVGYLISLRDSLDMVS